MVGSCPARRNSSCAPVSSSRPLCYSWHEACPTLLSSSFLVPFLLSFASSSSLPSSFPLFLFASLSLCLPSHCLSDLCLRSQTSLGLNSCFATYHTCKLGQVTWPKSLLLNRVQANTYLLGSLRSKNVNKELSLVQARRQ